MPPLAERRKDIPLLISHFIKLLSARTGRPAPQISKRAMRALYDYAYPGNVRELRNVIERAFVLTSGDTIDLKHLPQEVTSFHGKEDIVTRARPSEKRIIKAEFERPNRKQLSPEKSRLLDILETYGWNRTLVARELGIGRTTLWRRMKEYGLA